MKRVTNLGLHDKEEDQQNFRVSLLEARVRELEHIVHELLRGRVQAELADAWLEVAEKNTFPPTTNVIEGRGKHIAALLDRWPDNQKWADRPPLE